MILYKENVSLNYPQVICSSVNMKATSSSIYNLCINFTETCTKLKFAHRTNRYCLALVLCQ